MTPPDTEAAALADELEKARDVYLSSLGDLIPRAKAKQALIQLLWDDKGTIIAALRALSAPSSPETNSGGK